MRKHYIAPVAAAVMLAVAGSAQAATKTANLNVSAAVASNCFITTTPLTFADYDGTANVDATGTVSVRCSKGNSYVLSLNGGTTLGGTIAQRLLAGPLGDTLQYNLYTTAARNVIWGDGTTGSTQGATGTGLGNSVPYTVFGRVPFNATNDGAGVGAYSDVVTATVSY
jgi:spore coat protein U-like protein